MASNKNLAELEEQAAFQRKKLEEARIALESAPLVIEYDNGGGQRGIRENPEFAAYEKLMSNYHATLRAIELQKGGKAAEKQTGIGSPLKSFRDKHGFEVVHSA